MDCIGSPTRNSVRPSPGSQPAVSFSQQLKLRVRGILKFVHQDVLDAMPESESEIQGESSWPKRLRRPDRELGEIHPAALAEDQLQFADGQGQDRNGRAHSLPLRFRKTRGRQFAKDAAAPRAELSFCCKRARSCSMRGFRGWPGGKP